MSTRALIEHILEQRTFAVTGASQDKAKNGYKVYQTLKEAGYIVYAVNPNVDNIAGDPCYPSLDNVPEPIDCVVTVTPPAVTEATIQIAGRLKIPYAWMQPGSESTPAVNLARANSIQIISGGPCIMASIAERQARYAEAS